jgi:hypothetical protein
LERKERRHQSVAGLNRRSLKLSGCQLALV